MIALLPILMVLMATLALVGCRPRKPEPTTRYVDPRKEAIWKEEPLRIAQEPVSVAQGPSPLVYLFDVGGPIRVVDLTVGRTLLAMDVADRTLVRVDDRNGVTIGSENVVPGPLESGHRYAIYADPRTPNVLRRGIGPPGDVPR